MIKEILLFLFILMTSCTANASSWSELVDKVSMKYEVPPHIIDSICTHESQSFYKNKRQPWPWVVNSKGAGKWFRSEQGAILFAERELNGGVRNIDVGICQINWYWHGENFSSIAEMMNPINNVNYAAQYLKKLKKGGRTWEEVVGAYHSMGNQERAALYAELVLQY
ncbi:TPA: transglycosylase SLT domain-containing protein [Shewanella algae]|uniref:transglycosylase SLT domain-containing protein n=1 Tax=Shewanella TaxID=22 RepID=UPI001431C9D3|nr:MULTISPECIES: transglycosylase SLT domain-containing protein [Shewanella]NJI86973.1 lytic transglycosylase domain-containing protein [Shewanella sp. Iso12]HDS1208467.1 transglycosylase SLT domain-containing protein [Shewanella algae]